MYSRPIIAAVLLTVVAVLAAWLTRGILSASLFEINPRQVDFGTCEENSIVTQRFTICNSGSSEINVFDVHADCGCLSVTWDGATEIVRGFQLKPGQSTSLVCGFNTSGYEGIVQRSFRLRTNLPGHETIVVPMRANVVGSVHCHPDHVQFGNLKIGETANETVRIDDRGRRKPLRIGEVRYANHDQLNVRCRPVDRDGATFHQYLLEVTLVARVPGPFSDRIQIFDANEVNSDPVIQIPVHAHVREEYSISPSEILLPRRSGEGLDYTATLIVQNNLGIPFEIDAIDCPRDVEATFQDQPASIARGVVSIKGEGVSGFDGQLRIKVKTKNEARVLVVPITVLSTANP